MGISNETRRRGGIIRLEVFLAIAILALFFQLFPPLWHGTRFAMDVRNWSRGTWLGINLFLVCVLVSIRYLPEFLAVRRVKKSSVKSKRPTPESRVNELDLKAQQELFKRMQEARKRQIV
jgi:hypothetical protein